MRVSITLGDGPGMGGRGGTYVGAPDGERTAGAFLTAPSVFGAALVAAAFFSPALLAIVALR